MRQALKAIVGLVATVLVLPLLALYGLTIVIVPAGKARAFQGYSQLMSLLPGLTGEYLRRAFYRFALSECPPDCLIGFGTVFATPEVEIGHGVYIGWHGNLGHVSIGDDTLLGSNVTVLSGKHQHEFSRIDIPIRHQGGEFRRVRIGTDVWIGNGAIIMEDVGDHAVVAAGAVVIQPVAQGSVVGGNPARVLARRGEPDQAPQASSVNSDGS
jgi:virginiamycin A acetyltransferase